ncbi:TPA: hypothetical protein ACGO5J_001512, partial [Streptococcus suis]
CESTGCSIGTGILLHIIVALVIGANILQLSTIISFLTHFASRITSGFDTMPVRKTISQNQIQN